MFHFRCSGKKIQWSLSHAALFSLVYQTRTLVKALTLHVNPCKNKTSMLSIIFWIRIKLNFGISFSTIKNTESGVLILNNILRVAQPKQFSLFSTLQTYIPVSTKQPFSVETQNWSIIWNLGHKKFQAPSFSKLDMSRKHLVFLTLK